MKHLLLLAFSGCLLLFGLGINAQTKNQTTTNIKPKLVVGIVVDQMRNDYIYRYWNRFTQGGFKRLIEGGYYFKNTHYNYIPTFTGPGHCSIYTGATPKTHGIIANDWHIKSGKKEMYCVEDSSVKTVGSNNKNGMMSPIHQLSSTIGDELKMNTNNVSKVFGIALKDRSAILPAGRSANAAFWFDDETGNFITSTWYAPELPTWLKAFNDEKKCIKYLTNAWAPLYPISSYTNSIQDDNNYESVPNKKDKPIFNYEYKNYVEKNNVAIIKATPFGNSLTNDLAMACIKNEQLGKRNTTDLLCLSYSSPDIVAHAYGPRSIELEDLFLRLDKDLEQLFNYLDLEVGKNNYILFLTADRGGADVPHHLQDNKIHAGYLKESKLKKEIKNYLIQTYNDSLIFENLSNDQVFLNEARLLELKLDRSLVETNLCNFLVKKAGVAEAYPSSILINQSFNSNDYRTLLQNGYNQKLSGNVAYIYEPAYMDYPEKGTTHGSGYNYDTHVPLIFYGAGVQKGNSYQYTTITQIAPTVCELLQINQPNSTIAQPLNDFFNHSK